MESIQGKSRNIILLFLSLLLAFLVSKTGEIKAATQGSTPVTKSVNLGKIAVMNIRYYQGYNKIGIEIIPTKYSYKMQKIQEAIVSIIPPDKNKITIHLIRAKNGQLRDARELNNKKNGSWSVSVRLVGVKNKEIYSKPNVAVFKRRSWEWENNQLGTSKDIIVNPFTPIKVRNNRVSLLLREYRLGSLGLPEKIKADGKQILTNPIDLLVKFSNTGLKKITGKLTMHKNRLSNVSAESSSSMGNLLIKTNVSIEYDGFMWFKLNLKNKEDKKLVIDKLMLKIPMKEKYATLLHAARNETIGNPKGSIPAGNGYVWNSNSVKDRKVFGKSLFPNAFVPYLWVGEEKKGLSWFSENDFGYHLHDTKPPIRILRHNKEIVIKIDLINQATKINGERTLEFGFLATPVKNRKKGWRKIIHGRRGALPGMIKYTRAERYFGRGTIKDSDKYPENHDYRFWKTLVNATKTKSVDKKTLKDWNKDRNIIWRNKLAHIVGNMKRYMPWQYHGKPPGVTEFMNNAKEFELKTLEYAQNTDVMALYFDPRTETSYRPEVKYYSPEWQGATENGTGYDYRFYTFLTPSLIDYQLFYYKKYLELGFKSIHFDNLYILPGNNPDIGTGFYDERGRLHASMGILGTRELIKRLAVMSHEMGIDLHIAMHLTDTFILPYITFATSYEDWEYEDEEEFPDKHPPESVRAGSTGLQAGLYCAGRLSSMTEIKKYRTRQDWLTQRAWLTRTAMSLMLLHDMQGDEYEYNLQGWSIYSIVNGLKFKFGTYKEESRFIPYWSDNSPLILDDNFKGSYYKKDHSILLFISNFGHTGHTRVQFQKPLLQEIGNKKLNAYEIKISGHTATFKEVKNPIEVSIKRNDFTILYFGRKKDVESLTDLKPIKYKTFNSFNLD